MPFFLGDGHIIQPHYVEEEAVKWLTKLYLLLSFHSSSTAIPEVAQPTGNGDPATLFEHSISHLLQEDEQQVIGSDVGSEVDKESNGSLEGGEPVMDKQLAVKLLKPQQAAKLALLERMLGR